MVIGIVTGAVGLPAGHGEPTAAENDTISTAPAQNMTKVQINSARLPNGVK